ncbi:hypothetical protein [Pontibaca salina]|uniref:Cellulose-binding protein n=1 Tax=Pontibaca salina TaxID=2795731 RepID=A0A934HRN8_9RHOB|nr:hypothetical protein [Pontibaca salina]MBI6630202.1 hypothetical protein [Pontibaca salina]
MSWVPRLGVIVLLGQLAFGLSAPVSASEPEAVDAQPMAVNLTGVSDWSVQQPFINVMKSARPWIGHKPNQWGGMDYDELAMAGHLDENGWPIRIPHELSSIATLILTDLPEAAVSLAGRYRLQFEGDGIVEVGGRAKNLRFAPNEVTFDFTPGPGGVEVRIKRTDRKGTGDYIRNITVIAEDRISAYETGTIFNPDWLALIRDFGVVRFMDWMATNDSEQAHWSDRPLLSDYTWARIGVPVEIMLALANELDADPWFTMPHRSDDAYNLRFARAVRDGLNKNRRAYVEYSNEVWNWQFQQARWADEQARARWKATDSWMQFYGMRAAQIAGIWTDVFGASADRRLVRVISSQAGWLGLEKMALEAPLWQAEGNPAPYTAFDAYAITGYFGHILGTESRFGLVNGWLDDSLQAARDAAAAQGLRDAARDDYIAAHRYGHASALAAQELRDGSISGDPADTLADLLGNTVPWHAKVAQDHDLDLIMYEGGTHVVGIGPMVDNQTLTDFFIHLNYTPEMGELYRDLISGWHEAGGQLFNVFVDVSKPTKWGSWGALRFLSDSNPRWDAVLAAQ